MNPLVVSVIGLFMSASIVTSAQAALAPAKAVSKPGITNAKKVQAAKLRQDVKMRTAKKQAIAEKRQRLAKRGALQ